MSTMARFASQSLNYYRRSRTSSSIALFSPRILAQHHHYRHMSGKADSDDSSQSEGDSISKAMSKLDEAVQTFVIRRSAPDWLPFVPGASYWVPPPDPKHPCKAIIEILDRVSNSRRRRRSSLSEDETMMSYSSLLHGGRIEVHCVANPTYLFQANHFCEPHLNINSGSAEAGPMSVEVVMLENPEGIASDSDDEEEY